MLSAWQHTFEQLPDGFPAIVRGFGLGMFANPSTVASVFPLGVVRGMQRDTPEGESGYLCPIPACTIADGRVRNPICTPLSAPFLSGKL